MQLQSWPSQQSLTGEEPAAEKAEEAASGPAPEMALSAALAREAAEPAVGSET